MAKIRDRHVDWKSLDNIRGTFDQLIKTSSGVCDWIRVNTVRDDKSLIPFNFLACCITYLEMTRKAIPAPVQLVAFCTRSVYEISLLVRKVVPEVTEHRRWLAETVSDNLTVWEAFYDLFAKSSPEGPALRAQIDGLKGRVREMGFDSHQPPSRTAELAKSFGLEAEHKALFSLFSKLVHPSAFLINGWQHNKDETLGTTLLLHLLDYADQVLQLIGRELNVPKETLRW